MVLDPSLFPVVAAGVALVALGAGIVIGRRTGDAHARAKELEAQLETSAKEREFARTETEAARHETARIRSEFDDYRAEVVDHFTGTSGLLRALTLQYRAVYEHLTDGATTLCPEGSIDLLEGELADRLPLASRGSISKPPAAPEPNAAAPPPPGA